MHDLSPIKAIVFDTFGTVADFTGSIVREGEEWNRRKGWDADWTEIVSVWRGCYQPSLAPIIAGEAPFRPLDEIHRASLIETILPRFGLGGLSEEEVTELSYIWRRLYPWPDVVDGLLTLRHKFVVAPLSNANVELAAELAKFGGLPWDVILGADLWRQYKPHPLAYETAKMLLNCDDGEILLVAAHRYDLHAALEHGYVTAFLRRPAEHGSGGKSADEPQHDDDFALVVDSVEELAARLVGA